MLSFWPWKGDQNSPASFERTLSTLSVKITKTGGRLERLRQRARRLSVWWTLYSVFAYLLCTIVLLLVVGWRNWGMPEYTAVAAGPLVIYLVRLGLKTYYDYRASTVQAQLDNQQKQRDGTIEKLKTATKYNTTQELLKKYGGTPTPRPKPAEGHNEKGLSKRSNVVGAPRDRTSFVTPPTANIPGRQVQPSLSISEPRGPQSQPPWSSVTSPNLPQSLLSPQRSSGDFAPNAFPSAPQYAPANEGSRWYDRILDVLLGEDESLPEKRLALICSHCRLVNGQAPPGVKRLEDVGKWRCGGCGAMNGEDNYVHSIIQSLQEQNSSESERPRKGKESSAASEDFTKLKSVSQSEDQYEGNDVTESSQDSHDSAAVAKQKPMKTSESPRRRSTRTKKSRKQAG